MNGTPHLAYIVQDAQGEGSQQETELVHDVGEELLDRAREVAESIVKRVRQLTESDPTNDQESEGSH